MNLKPADEDNQLTAAIQVLNGTYDPAQAAIETQTQ
jgi:hypothetical protein